MRQHEKSGCYAGLDKKINGEYQRMAIRSHCKSLHARGTIARAIRVKVEESNDHLKWFRNHNYSKSSQTRSATFLAAARGKVYVQQSVKSDTKFCVPTARKGKFWPLAAQKLARPKKCRLQKRIWPTLRLVPATENNSPDLGASGRLSVQWGCNHVDLLSSDSHLDRYGQDFLAAKTAFPHQTPKKNKSGTVCCKIGPGGNSTTHGSRYANQLTY